MLLMSQLWWSGHISRMKNHHLPRIIPCEELYTGHHNKRALKKWYRDCQKKSLGAWYINYWQWSTLAENCHSWHLSTNYVVSSFENTCRASLKDKRFREKDHNTMPSNPDQTFSCSDSNHVCQSCMRLISHECACSQCEPPILDLYSWSQAMMMNISHKYVVFTCGLIDFKIIICKKLDFVSAIR